MPNTAQRPTGRLGLRVTGAIAAIFASLALALGINVTPIYGWNKQDAGVNVSETCDGYNVTRWSTYDPANWSSAEDDDPLSGTWTDDFTSAYGTETVTWPGDPSAGPFSYKWSASKPNDCEPTTPPGFTSQCVGGDLIVTANPGSIDVVWGNSQSDNVTLQTGQSVVIPSWADAADVYATESGDYLGVVARGNCVTTTVPSTTQPSVTTAAPTTSTPVTTVPATTAPPTTASPTTTAPPSTAAPTTTVPATAPTTVTTTVAPPRTPPPPPAAPPGALPVTGGSTTNQAAILALWLLLGGGVLMFLASFGKRRTA
jgi:hypothetical protein